MCDECGFQQWLNNIAWALAQPEYQHERDRLRKLSREIWEQRTDRQGTHPGHITPWQKRQLQRILSRPWRYSDD